MRVGEVTQALTPGITPRIEGLFQNEKLYGTEAPITALIPLRADPESVFYKVDDGIEFEVKNEAALPGDGPLMSTLFFSMGGYDASMKVKPFSFIAFPDGPHSVTATLRLRDGTLSARVLHFTLSSGATGSVGWAADIKPIFDARCAKCHTTGPGREMTSYELWKTNSTLIVNAVKDLRMPADGPLDPTFIQKIARWANGGMLP